MTEIKPTVLIFSHTAETYGAERILLSIVKNLRNCFEVHVALPEDGPLVGELALLDDVHLHRFTLLRFTMRPLDCLANLFKFIPFVLSVVRLLKTVQPDVVYCNTIRNQLTGVVARLLGYPVIFHSHERNFHGMLGKLFAGIAAVTNNVNVFVCNYVAQSYTKLAPSLADKSRVIYNGVTIAPPVVQSEGFCGAFPLLMSIAQLAPHKRLDDLLQAMPHIVKRFPSVHLVIIGEGMDRLKLERLITRLSLEKSVTLTGFRRDVHGLLATADIFLAPFAGEGLNTAAIEAMHCGKPVVAAASGGLLEIVEDGKTGFFHEVGNISEIVEIVSTLAGSEELRQKMGEMGRLRAETMFSLRNQAGHMCMVVKEVAGTGQARGGIR